MIRLGTPSDFESVALVMYDAVRNGRSLYSEEQRRAWVPKVRSGSDWTTRLSTQTLLIAEVGSEVVGFMSVTAQQYIDFAYIRPNFQGTGLFRRLYSHLEAIAREKGFSRLWVHASLMAEPAFSAVGFLILSEQTVELGGQRFRRYEMEKTLSLAQEPEVCANHGE